MDTPLTYRIYRRTFNQLAMLAKARRSDGTHAVVRARRTIREDPREYDFYDRARDCWIPERDWIFTDAAWPPKAD